MHTDINDALKICYRLKIDDTFYSESDIVNSLPEFRLKARRKTFDLVNPDGALSIQWYGRELLGEKYWDEIFFTMLGILFGWEDLLVGETIEIRFALNPIRLTLTRRHSHLHYQLKSLTSSFMIDKTIPFNIFLREWLHCLCRVARLRHELGANEHELIQSLREKAKCDALNYQDIKFLHDALDKPLVEVITEYKC